MARGRLYLLIALLASVAVVAGSDSDNDSDVDVEIDLPTNIYGGLEKGDHSFRVDARLLWQAISEGIGNGFSSAKAIQVIDGGDVVGQFQKVINLSEDMLGSALKSGLLEVESSVSQSQCDGSTSVESDEMSVKSRLWTELGFKAPVGVGTAGASVKPSHSTAQIDHVSEVNINTKCVVSLFSVNLTPKGDQLKTLLEPSLVDMWNALPTRPSLSSRKEYFNFFNRYGTHVVRAASFGGLASLTASVDTSLLKKVDNAKLRMGVSLWLSGASAGGGGSISATQTIKMHRSEVSFKLTVAGGDSGLLKIDSQLTEPIAFENLNRWKKSLQNKVARVSTEIGTISEFMDVALGASQTADDKDRIKLFDYYLTSEFEKLGRVVEKNRWVAAQLLGTLDDYSKTLFEVMKIQSSRGFLSGGTGKTLYSLSRTFDGVGSVVCNSIPFVCDQRCLALENIEFVQKKFFDVHPVGASTVSCRSSCVRKYSSGCENFSIGRSDFVEADPDLPLEKKNVAKQGWVWKRNKRKFYKRGQWLKRYLILSAKSLYYKKTIDTDQVGIIRLNQIGGIVKGLPLELADGFGFRIASYDRMWIFKCSSEEERDEWVEALMSHSHQFCKGGCKAPLVYDLKAALNVPEATALSLDSIMKSDDEVRSALNALKSTTAGAIDTGYVTDDESIGGDESQVERRGDDSPIDEEDDDSGRDDDGEPLDGDGRRRRRLEDFLARAQSDSKRDDSRVELPYDMMDSPSGSGSSFP